MSSLIIFGADQLAVGISEPAKEAKESALWAAEMVQSVRTPEDAERASEALQLLANLKSTTEKSRVEVKAPVLEIGRRIDSVAADYVAEVVWEIDRIKRLVGDYTAAQKAAAAAAEAERQKAIEEDRRKVLAIQKANEEAEAAAAKAAAEAAKAPQSAPDKAGGVDAVSAVPAPPPAAVFFPQALPPPPAALFMAPIKPASTPGIKSREVWRYEVVSLETLHAQHAGLTRIEPVASEINAAIAAGNRNIPGVRIWKDDEVVVRASRGSR